MGSEGKASTFGGKGF